MTSLRRPISGSARARIDPMDDEVAALRVDVEAYLARIVALEGGGIAYGTTAGTACEGNDSRLSDARTPTSHASGHLPGGADEVFTAATAIAISGDSDRRTLAPGTDNVTDVANVLASHLRDCHANKFGRVS